MVVIFLVVWFFFSAYVDALQIQALDKYSIVKKDKLTGDLYVSDGSHIRAFNAGMHEIHTYDLRGKGNDIKILELINPSGSQYLFVCLQDGKFGQCCLIDIQSNRTFSVSPDKDISELLNASLTINSIICDPYMGANVLKGEVYMCLSSDKVHNDTNTHLIHIAELLLHNKTVRLLPNSIGSYNKPQAYGDYVISTSFYYGNSSFFLINRTDIQLGSSSGSEASILVQVNHTYAPNITFVTIPLRHHAHPIQITGTLFCNKDLGDYLVIVNKNVDTQQMMVQHVSMATVMRYIDLTIQNSGREVYSSDAGNTRGILRSTLVLGLEMSPWQHNTPDHPIDSFLVVSRREHIVAYYTTSKGGDKREIFKMRLGSNSNPLPWKDEIITLDTARCTYLGLSDCYHDNECTWCGRFLGTCKKKDMCEEPENVDKLVPFSVTRTEPPFGFSCGGSVVHIIGRDLDLAKNISVTIGGQNCDVIRELSTKDMLEVRVPNISNVYLHSVKTRVVLPNGVVFDEDFQYLNCPKITESATEVKMIGSGGNRIEIYVGNIGSITNTTFYMIEVVFLHENVVVATVPLSNVSRVDIHSFKFIAPPLNDFIDKRLKLGLAAPTYHLLDRPNPQTILYGDLSNLTVIVNKDPVICGIATGEKTTHIKQIEHEDDTRTIVFTGNNLGTIHEDDVSVDIVSLAPCTSVTINRSSNRLTCDLPWPKDFIGSTRNYYIVVKIGLNLIYHPGEVRFIMDNARRSTVPQTFIPEPEPKPEPELENSSSQVLQIVIPLTIVIALLFTSCVFICYRFRIFQGRREPIDRDLPSIVSYRSNHGVFIGESRPSFQANSVDNLSTDSFITETVEDSAQLIINIMEEEGWVLKKRDLNIDIFIGRGNFGSVYKGHLSNNSERIEIAVKTLQRDNQENMDITQFLKEAFVMKNFQHVNVMTLVGVCLDAGDMPLVIMPYMKHGDLLAYLQEEKHIPTVKDLVCFGLGITLGMEYLASLKFVHRDLAARNCMLDLNYTLKVADFGLSRDVYETSYYSTQSKGIKLPVKWMSIESLSGGVFNERTDVWSFGITLWELMTRGVRPYAAVDSWDMEAYLKSGRRLPQPIYCPAKLYKLMRKCWSQEPEDRPTFTIVKDWISELLNRVHHQLGDMESTTNIENTYVNIGQGNQCIYENLANF